MSPKFTENTLDAPRWSQAAPVLTGAQESRFTTTQVVIRVTEPSDEKIFSPLARSSAPSSGPSRHHRIPTPALFGHIPPHSVTYSLREHVLPDRFCPRIAVHSANNHTWHKLPCSETLRWWQWSDDLLGRKMKQINAELEQPNPDQPMRHNIIAGPGAK